MKVVEKRNSIGHLAVLTALWFINILIVIFSSPFLIYKKVRQIFLKTEKTSIQNTQTSPEPARYVPCGIDSKL
jgi:hypothetical protein